MNLSSPNKHTEQKRSYAQLLLALLLTLNFCSPSHAQQPTAAQIEYVKNLTPAQQQAMAKSMGINLDSLGASPGNQNTKTNQANEPITGNRQTSHSSMTNDSPLTAGNGILSLDEDQAPETTNDEIPSFGYDIFDFGGEAFTPATDIPIPANYILGPGDTIIVQLYGKENATHNLTLSREGQIQFPGIGPVSLAGLPFDQMKLKVAEIVNQQMIGIKSSVTMGSLRTIRIFVLGEVQIPGSYVVSSLSTMTNAIFASGGITEIGSLRNVQLKRAGKTVTTLDLYELLLQGDTSGDSRLLPGDVIFIPPIGKTAGVTGEVKRPAIYELKSETTVEQVIKLAGGLLPTAYVPASRIERITKAGEKTLVNLDVSSANGRSFLINDADIVQIFSTLDTIRDIVKLEGHVKRPGGFAWRDGMHFTDIAPNADDLLANPDIAVGLIQREDRITRKITVHLFTPEKAFANPKSTEDPLLHPRDTVTMFEYDTDRTEVLAELIEKLKTQSSFEQLQQTVSIYGSVRFPGEYPLAAKNMSARGLINLAGGLTENAQGSGAEITRFNLNERRERVDLRMDFDLTSENPFLLPGDTLRVKQIPLWQVRESVALEGEVLHPGIYDLLPGETMLSVIERAGGLTPYAYPEGAIFSREELRDLEAERLENLKSKVESELAATSLEQKNSNVSEADSSLILKNIDQTEALGRMVIDLKSILNEPNKFDFELTNGDVLNIPRFKPSVTIVGEIQHPTSHFYDENLSVTDYIDISGGTKETADKSRIYVVKANGSVYTPASSAWFRKKSNRLAPGDTIIVPIDTNKVDAVSLWTSVTQIMYQSALGIAALASL